MTRAFKVTFTLNKRFISNVELIGSMVGVLNDQAVIVNRKRGTVLITTNPYIYFGYNNLAKFLDDHFHKTNYWALYVDKNRGHGQKVQFMLRANERRIMKLVHSQFKLEYRVNE